MMQYLKEITEDIEDLINSRKIVIIGIDGLGGAGKSTISEELKEELDSRGIGTVLLHIDDFITPRSVRYNSAYPDWQCYYDLQWRFDYFKEVVSRLRSCTEQSTDIELYDKDNDSYYTETVSAGGKSAVIVEGIFLQRKEYRGLFDYTVYIDIPEEIRLNRVLKRDTYIGNEQEITDKYNNRYFPAERKYFEEYQPQRTADRVIGE